MLPQWFRHKDSGWIPTLKLVWKFVTRSSILFICNTFCCWLILLLSLYTELALVCCTNPDTVNCFGNIFPNLNFVFVSICAARPVHFQSEQFRSCWTVKQRCAVGAAPHILIWSNQKQRCGSEFAKWQDIYTPEECADGWRQNNADLKLLKNSVMNGHHVRHHECSWRPLDWRIRHSHLTSTLFHSLVPWWSPWRIWPQRTRLSQLENAALGTWPVYKNYYTRLVRNMAWCKILIHVLIV